MNSERLAQWTWMGVLAGVHLQLHQEVHGAVLHVLELPLFDQARSHPIRGAATLQHLDAGLLVQAQHRLALLGQGLGAFVASDDLGGLALEGVVRRRRLPVPRAMRL
jgi:hypothetical protein